MILLSNLAFDCVDAARVAAFWRRALLYDAPEPTDAELAAALEEHPEWAGLAVVDEEGNRHPRLFLQTVPKPRAVEIDAVNPSRQVQFWVEMLGFGLDGASCNPPDSWRKRVSLFPSFSFVPVDAPKERKNRIHFDFMTRPEEGDHERLLEMGARDVAKGDGFVTVHDPEANEFDLSV